MKCPISKQRNDRLVCADVSASLDSAPLETPSFAASVDKSTASADVSLPSADKSGLSLGEGLGLGAAAGTLGAGAAAIGLTGDKLSLIHI